MNNLTSTRKYYEDLLASEGLAPVADEWGNLLKSMNIPSWENKEHVDRYFDLISDIMDTPTCPLERRVLNLHNDGLSNIAVGKAVGLSEAYVRRTLKKWISR